MEIVWGFTCNRCKHSWFSTDYNEKIGAEIDYCNGMACPHCDGEDIKGKEIKKDEIHTKTDEN
jgi:hypothetical protein